MGHIRNSATARNALVRNMNAVRHLTLPFHESGRVDPLPGETIGAAAMRMGVARRIRDGRRKRWVSRLPTICVVNGRPVLQREWTRRRIKPADQVEFWSRPWGKQSSGKQIVGIVALIALATFAPWAGGVLAGAGTIAATAISGAPLAGGALLVTTAAPRLTRWARIRAWFRAHAWGRA